MSLIAEALRKAHLDATRQEATRHGRAPYVPAAGRSARRRSRAPWIAALVASNLVIALLLLGAFRLTGGQREPASAVPAPEGSPATVATPAPEGNPASSHEATASSPEPVPPPAPERAATPQASPPPPPPAPRSAQPPAGPSEPSRLADGAALPGGRRLELSGILSTPLGNQAIINDRLVQVGHRIEGFTVVRIDRREVELRGDAGVVLLDAP